MQENLNAALDLIIRWEGSDINRSPREPGGISKYGISLQTYADYEKKLGNPPPTADDIANLTEPQARDFYSVTFLPAMRFNDLPNGVDVRLVDIAVNLGITGAINCLEMVLLQNLLTGVISDNLIKVLNSYDAKMVVFALSAAWISNKHTKPSWFDDGTGHGYGAGWTNRNIDLTNKTLGMIK